MALTDQEKIASIRGALSKIDMKEFEKDTENPRAVLAIKALTDDEAAIDMFNWGCADMQAQDAGKEPLDAPPPRK